MFPEGVEVHEVDLTRTESTKSTAILGRQVDSTTPGVVSGLAVTVNGGNVNRVDISAGYGYAPNGERVSSASVTGLTVPDTTLGGVNYILLVYSETYNTPEGHETNGHTYPTASSEASRIVALTSSAYLALPTSDPDFSHNDLSRALVLAIVTSSGTGVAPSSIVVPPTYNSIVSIGPLTPTTNGLTLQSISQGTLTGTGTFKLYPGAPYKISWTPPSGLEGTQVSITADGQYTLPATGSSAVVNVVLASLPGTSTSVTCSVTNLYAPTRAQRNTARDDQHRNMVGTGVVTATNPHGLSVQDLVGNIDSPVIEHQQLQHSNGIWGSAQANTLQLSVDTSAGPNQYKQVLIQPVSGANFAYVNGRKVTACSPTTIGLTGVDGTDQELYGFYMDDVGNITAHRRVAMLHNSVFQASFQVVGCAPGIAAGTKNLAWLDGTDPTNPYTFRFDGGPYYAQQFITGSVIRMYGSDPVNSWIDVYVNASFFSGGQVTVTEAVTFDAPQDTTVLMPIAWVTCSGSNYGNFLGYGFTNPPYHNPNSVIDLRVFGTISDRDLSPGRFERDPYVMDAAQQYLDDEAAKYASTALLGAGFYLAGSKPTWPGVPDQSVGLQLTVSASDVTPIVYINPGVCTYDLGLPDDPSNTMGSQWTRMQVLSTLAVPLAASDPTNDRYDIIEITPNPQQQQLVYKNVWDPTAAGGAGAYVPSGSVQAIIPGVTVTVHQGTPGAGPSYRQGPGVIAMVKVRATATTVLSTDIYDWRTFERSKVTMWNKLLAKNGSISCSTISSVILQSTHQTVAVPGVDIFVKGAHLSLRSTTLIDISAGTNLNLDSGTNLTTRGWLYLYAVHRPSQRGAPIDFIFSHTAPGSASWGPHASPALVWPDGWHSSAGEGVFLASFWCPNFAWVVGQPLLLGMQKTGDTVTITESGQSGRFKPSWTELSADPFKAFDTFQTMSYTAGAESNSYDYVACGWGRYISNADGVTTLAHSTTYLDHYVRVNDQANSNAKFAGGMPTTASRMKVRFQTQLSWDWVPQWTMGVYENNPVSAAVAIGTFISDTDSVIQGDPILTVPYAGTDPNVVDFHVQYLDLATHRETVSGSYYADATFSGHEMIPGLKAVFELDLKAGQIYWLPLLFTDSDPTTNTYTARDYIGSRAYSSDAGAAWSFGQSTSKHSVLHASLKSYTEPTP